MPRRTARDLESAAAARARRPGRPAAPLPEPLAMLRRRGLDPRPSPPDLPIDAAADPTLAEALAARLAHYAFRLFLRGAILRPRGFAPGEATRYLPASKARAMAGDLVALGIAEPLARGRYRLVRAPRSFGGTLEWWIGREIASRLGLAVTTGVRSGAPGVGGDLDVVAAGEGKLIYVETKSSPPKHIAPAELGAFVRRVRALRPDVSLLVVDTALRLSDKVLPMLARAVARGGNVPCGPPRRIFRETFAVTPHLYAVNAREDLIENVCRAIAEGLRELAPPAP